jgi:GTP cyclohydrolase I
MPLSEKEIEQRQFVIAKHYREILVQLGINVQDDPNSRDTPQRVAKMLVREMCRGRFSEPPELREFDNTDKYDELITVGPVTVRSMCSHHHLPIEGHAILSVLPSIKSKGKVLGLSKYARVVDWFAGRPQIQEALTQQIATYLFNLLEPRALGVRIQAKHFCMSHRGVKEPNAQMITTSLRGDLLINPSLKAEFISDCQSLLGRV